MLFPDFFKKNDNCENLTKNDLKRLLSAEDTNELESLYAFSQKIKWKTLGNKVYLRGLIELSNICIQNCNYCGIRKDNKIERFLISEKDLIEYVGKVVSSGIPSVVIQSGERRDEEFVDFIELCLKRLKKTFPDLMVTLSLGEQTEDVYKRWVESGATRYLLRIETSNRELFKKIHPPEISFDNRLSCLEALRKTGYQVGTGVMIGLPGQTVDDLVSDILIFKEFDIDMIGMGPYIPHTDTPLGESLITCFYEAQKTALIEKSLKMIVACRLYLENVNIASTTALNTLSNDGFIKGIKAGANVIMPDFTDFKYRKSYNLYQGKAGLTEYNLNELEKELLKIGETIAWDETGSSLHFQNRIK